METLPVSLCVFTGLSTEWQPGGQQQAKAEPFSLPAELVLCHCPCACWSVLLDLSTVPEPSGSVDYERSGQMDTQQVLFFTCVLLEVGKCQSHVGRLSPGDLRQRLAHDATAPKLTNRLPPPMMASETEGGHLASCGCTTMSPPPKPHA